MAIWERNSMTGMSFRAPALSWKFIEGFPKILEELRTACLQTILLEPWFWIQDLKREWQWALLGEGHDPFSPCSGLRRHPSITQKAATFQAPPYVQTRYTPGWLGSVHRSVQYEMLCRCEETKIMLRNSGAKLESRGIMRLEPGQCS